MSMLRRVRDVLLCLALVGILPAAGSVYITGRVYKQSTRQPIPGAVVFLDRLDGDLPARFIAQSPCLVNGSFMLKAPAAGRYRLKVDGNGAVLLQKLVVVPKAASFSVDLPVGVVPHQALAFDPVPKTPMTLELSTGLGRMLPPVPVDAWVEVLWEGQEKPCGAGGTMAVQKDGSLLLSPPPSATEFDPHSTVVITVGHPPLGCGQVRVEGWPTLPVHLNLLPPLTLSGVVQDRADGPVPHATVLAVRMVRVGCVLRRADHLLPTVVTADAAGHFAIPNLCAGTYDVRGLVPGGVTCRRLHVLSWGGPPCILSARDDPGGGPLVPVETAPD